jgi:UDP-glucuronate decarboxylase
MDYHRQHGVDVRIVRIFNTYGPNMLENDGRVVSNFICQALREKPLTVYGDGSQTRSFCYVEDLVEGLVRMMQAEGFTGPVNLGNPDEFTVAELAQKVLAMTGSTSPIVYCPLPENDPQRRRPDITLAYERLNWKPHIPLDIGLERTIAYFRQVLAEPSSRAARQR